MLRHPTSQPAALRPPASIATPKHVQRYSEEVIRGEYCGQPLPDRSPCERGRLFGRADLLHRVGRELGHSNVVLLEGQRRIGKSSFLHQLALYFTDEAEERHFLPLFFDIQTYLDNTLPEFAMHLATTIAKGLDIPVPPLTGWESDPALFREWLPEVFRRLDSRQIVMLVDEFDNLGEVGGGRAIETLLPFIGALVAREQRLKWVLTVGRHMGNLPIQYDSIIAPAVKLSLGRLTAQETEQLIVNPPSVVLAYQPAAIARIFQLTSGQPHLTQALCKEVFDHVVLGEERTEATDDDVNAVLDSTLASYEGAISSIARVPAIEERVQAAVAQLTAGGHPAVRDEIVRLLLLNGVSLAVDELDRSLDRLVEWDLLERENGGWRPAIELVRVWVVRAIPVAPSREQTLDIASARARSRYQFAEEARRRGQVEIAVEEYQEALKHLSTHQGALRGLAECYRLTGNLAGRVATLQKLHLQDACARPELVEALAVHTHEVETAGDLALAADGYEALIKLQGGDRWGPALTRVCLREVERQLGEPAEAPPAIPAAPEALARARQVLERGLALVQEEEPEASNLATALQRVAHGEWIHATRAHARQTADEEDWEVAGLHLIKLHKAAVELTPDELKALRTAAWYALDDRTGAFYRRFPWWSRLPLWIKHSAGGLIGAIEAFSLISLVPRAAGWWLAVFGVLMALNIGLARGLARRRFRRVLGIYLLAAGAIISFLITFDLLSTPFPPETWYELGGALVWVLVPLALAGTYEADTGVGCGSLFVMLLATGAAWFLFSVIFGLVMDDQVLTPVATGLTVALGWLFVAQAARVRSENALVGSAEATRILGGE